MRTYSPKPADIQREWHVIDATDVVLGRLAVQVATLLRGKHKPTFAPHVDGGDFVIVVNAGKVSLSGDKATKKLAYRHSGYPGGLSSTPYGELLEKDPRQRHREGRVGHAPQEPAQPPDAQQAQGVRRPRAPARRRRRPSRSRSSRSPSNSESSSAAGTRTRKRSSEETRD